MKAITLALGTVALLTLFSTAGQAATYNFGPECDEGGCGTATMDINIIGNTLTLLLDNTSPLTGTDTTSVNSPGITGFGFNLADPSATLLNWTLTASNTDGTGPVRIDDQGGTDDWKMGTTIAGVSLDFLPTTDGQNIDGALYNPGATAGLPGGSNASYETQAILTMVFDKAPVLAIGSCEEGDDGDCVAFVRMQNVGIDGDGSLKLTVVPVPAAAWLFGSALIGLAGIARRKKNA